MYTKFPFSMENIPRQRSFACLSLKFGCILSALIIILYSVLSLAQCTAVITDLAPNVDPADMLSIITFTLVIFVTIMHIVTLFLTALMLVGTLREKACQMRPWVVWTSIQVMVYFLLFVFKTTTTVINHPDGSLLVYYVLEFMGLLIRFYMLMLVASYYKQLEDEQYEGERVKTLVNNEIWYNSA